LVASKKNPEQTGNEIGEFLKNDLNFISEYNIFKGFLNISFTEIFWIDILRGIIETNNFGFKKQDEKSKRIVVEYSSPNTNKPLHLGHIRNNFLGWSASEILKANGFDVIKVNLINDRGIHICKSMLAWEMFANGETPQIANMKGDHYVGNYYVMFDKEYKKEISQLMNKGMSEKEAADNSELMKKAQNMLKKWERGNEKVREVWKMMNDWVYSGFDETYKSMGINFDKIYYESETYLKGKEIVMNGLLTGELKQKPDGTVYIDLTEYGMDEKVLLRADGTSVYMTQDLGTVVDRYNDYQFDETIYVVGNEQDYHFKVLSIVLDRLEYSWSNKLTHLSYGMVELPEGKMKSREGTVVDADDLIFEMIKTAKETAEELGKLEGFSEEEKNEIYRKIALGALKFFILKVDAKKNMTFNPKESIDFNGNTGPFVQYTYVRIKSILLKAKELGIVDYKEFHNTKQSEIENSLIKNIYLFAETIAEAGSKRNPAVIANYVYELAKEFNRFYHEMPILKEDDRNIKNFRISLADKTGIVIKDALSLLGIEVPERM
jgi:arginyl-tRNA synthetase